MMETDDNISEVMSAIDVTALLESLNSDKEFREQTRASAMSSFRLVRPLIINVVNVG